MKKILSITLVLFAFAFSNAQESKFGVKAGLTAQTYRNPVLGTTVTGSATGIYAGAYTNIGLSEKLSFRPEFLIIAVSNANTINVPLLAQYKVADKINVFAGPGLYYNISAAANNFSVSGDIGGSYDITEKIVGEVRYDIGLVGDIKQGGLFVGGAYKF